MITRPASNPTANATITHVSKVVPVQALFRTATVRPPMVALIPWIRSCGTSSARTAPDRQSDSVMPAWQMHSPAIQRPTAAVQEAGHAGMILIASSMKLASSRSRAMSGLVVAKLRSSFTERSTLNDSQRVSSAGVILTHTVPEAAGDPAAAAAGLPVSAHLLPK